LNRERADGPLALPANRGRLNAKFAAMLGSPMLLILDYDEEATLESLHQRVLLSANAVRESGAEVLGIIINKVSYALCTRATLQRLFLINSKRFC
jgi:BioD-like phosphotransacetylase family protein